MKENQPELLREAERLTQQSPTGVQPEPGREIRYWHLPEVDWPVADRLVRVVKTVRIEQQRRVTVRAKDAPRTKGKTARGCKSDCVNGHRKRRMESDGNRHETH